MNEDQDVEELMKKQKHAKQEEEQYDNVMSLGWKSFLGAFFVILLGIIIYAAMNS